jgi:hypothetical protein
LLLFRFLRQQQRASAHGSNTHLPEMRHPDMTTLFEVPKVCWQIIIREGATHESVFQR